MTLEVAALLVVPGRPPGHGRTGRPGLVRQPAGRYRPLGPPRRVRGGSGGAGGGHRGHPAGRRHRGTRASSAGEAGSGMSAPAPVRSPTPSSICTLACCCRATPPCSRCRARCASYWRLTSLDTFTGQDWISTNSYRSFGDQLPGSRRCRLTPGPSRSSFRCRGWDRCGCPTPSPRCPSPGVRHVSYDPVSGSLITSHPTSDGLDYTVESYQYLSDLSPAQLNSAPPVAVTSSLRRYLQLPEVDPRRTCTPWLAPSPPARPPSTAKRWRCRTYFLGPGLHLQPEPARRWLRHQRPDDLPVRHPHRLLPAVRRCLRGAGPGHRLADPAGGRVRHGHRRRQRQLPGAQRRCPHLAGGVLRSQIRLAAVRAHQELRRPAIRGLCPPFQHRWGQRSRDAERTRSAYPQGRPGATVRPDRRGQHRPHHHAGKSKCGLRRQPPPQPRLADAAGSGGTPGGLDLCGSHPAPQPVAGPAVAGAARSRSHRPVPLG